MSATVDDQVPHDEQTPEPLVHYTRVPVGYIGTYMQTPEPGFDSNKFVVDAEPPTNTRTLAYNGCIGWVCPGKVPRHSVVVVGDCGYPGVVVFWAVSGICAWIPNC